MRKVVLFFMALCALTVACQKTGSVKVPVTYTVETDKNTPLVNIYIPDTGIYNMPVIVKYMSGAHDDKVTMTIKGLPADIKVYEDSFSKVPTYTGNFVFMTNHAVHATYPVSVITSAPGTATKSQVFNVTVVSADCASALFGTYTGSNQCTGRNYTYTATVMASGAANTLDIVNLGGYGSSTLTHVNLNCNRDSLYIPAQNIGNGTNLSGYGVFTGNTLKIYYSATTTPGGYAEVCNATLTR